MYNVLTASIYLNLKSNIWDPSQMMLESMHTFGPQTEAYQGKTVFQVRLIQQCGSLRVDCNPNWDPFGNICLKK